MKSKISGPSGILRFWTPDPRTKAWIPGKPVHNMCMDTWGYAAAMCLGFRKPEYAISAMYLEFENVDDPEDPVTIPTFNQTAGLEYYLNLEGSPTRDFLRVPLVSAPVLSVEDGYEGSFAPGQGNKITEYAQTAGSEGFFGKLFSSSSNSKLCGAALVVVPDWRDQTLDIICNRAYVATESQLVKPTGLHLSASWELSFLPPAGQTS